MRRRLCLWTFLAFLMISISIIVTFIEILLFAYFLDTSVSWVERAARI